MPDFNFTPFWNAFSNASYILTHSVIFISKPDQWMPEIGVYLGEQMNWTMTTTSPPLPRDDLKIILSRQKVEKWYLKYVALSLNSVDHRNLTLQPCVLKSATLMENQFTWKIHISSNATLNKKQHTRSS